MKNRSSAQHGRRLREAIQALACLWFLAGCASSVGAPSGSAQATLEPPTYVPAAPPTQEPTVAAGPSPSAGSSPTASATTIPSVGSTAAPTSAATLPPVTLADNGKMLTLHPGDRFLLQLGDEYNWTVSVEDQSIVSRLVNVLPIRGAQGIYEAKRAGRTELTAVGDPKCRQARPPCGMPSRLFRLSLVVE